jgi:hypothetical protein
MRCLVSRLRGQFGKDGTRGRAMLITRYFRTEEAWA